MHRIVEGSGDAGRSDIAVDPAPHDAAERHGASRHQFRRLEVAVLRVGEAEMDLAFIAKAGLGDADIIAIVEIDRDPAPRQLERNASSLEPRSQYRNAHRNSELGRHFPRRSLPGRDADVSRCVGPQNEKGAGPKSRAPYSYAVASLLVARSQGVSELMTSRVLRGART